MQGSTTLGLEVIGRGFRMGSLDLAFIKLRGAFNIFGGLKRLVRRKVLGQVTGDLLALKGFYQMLIEQEMLIEDPKQDYLEVRKALNTYLKLKTTYSESDYFGSDEIKETMEKALQYLYSIEAELKILAHRGKEVKKTEKELKLVLSLTSQRALQAKLRPN